MLSVLGELGIVLLLTLANGLFAAAEIALLSIRPARLSVLIDEGASGAKTVAALRKNPDNLLATVQVGITVISASAAVFGGATIAGPVASGIEALGLSPTTARELAFVGVIAGLSYFSLVLGELVPKSLALRFGERYALLVARPLHLLARVARPLIWFLTKSSNLLLSIFGDRTTFAESRTSPDELRLLVEEAGRSGSLDPKSSEIAARALELRELTAVDVMVPRSRMVGIARDASLEEVKRVLLEESHSRLPVFGDSTDEVIGYVVAKDLLAMAFESKLVVLQDVLRPVYFVPTLAKAINVLAELQRRREQMAVVVDEQGGIAGLLTIEDLLEELVGDIPGEGDLDEVDPIRAEAGVAVVQGATPLRDINRALGLDLHEGSGFSTIGGLCTALAGAIPGQGERFQVGDVGLEVLDSSPRRVRLVRITLPPPTPEPSPGSDEA